MWRKLLFFCLLYFVQGAALAYVINFQKPYLAGHGVSKEALGFFTGLLLIPFIIKVGLGYVSDRFPIGKWGARKPYMIFGLGLFALCFFSLTAIDPGKNFFLFAIVMWTASLGLAWFDTCADGWAVDTSEDHEQSAIQAAMIVGKSLGLVTMSALFGLLALKHGFGVIFMIVGTLATLVLGVVFFVQHKPRDQRRGELIHGWRGLLQPYYIFFAFYAVVYATASFGTDGLVTLHLSETGHASSLDIGIFGMYRGLGALLGAVAFALLRPWFGARLGQFTAAFLLAAGCLLPLWGWPTMGAASLWGFAWGFQETAFVTLAMRFAQGRWAATLFAGSMIFANLGNSLGEALGAPLVPQIGFSGVFVMFAALALASAAFIPKIYQPLGKN